MSKVVTGKVRFSYVNVFEPKDMGGELKYSVAVLIPKADTDTYNRLLAEINKIAQEAISEVFGGIMPANLAMPIYDGDGLKPSGESYGQECKGHWVINAKSSNAPDVVDANCNFIINKNEFYSGCYGRVSLNFYAYNKNGNKGIGCGLGNVQKLEDGQPLDGRTTALEDFGGTSTAQPAVPQYQAPMQQQAVQAQTAMPQYQAPAPAVPVQALVQPVTTQYQAPVAPVQQPIQGQTLNNIYGVN